jgi:hypothetical protein
MTLYFLAFLIAVFFITYACGRVIFKPRKRKRDKWQHDFKGVDMGKAFHERDKKKPVSKYPLFIPFYEYHAFWRGLHWENKLFYTSKGKFGRCPKNFDNPFK